MESLACLLFIFFFFFYAFFTFQCFPTELIPSSKHGVSILILKYWGLNLQPKDARQTTSTERAVSPTPLEKFALLFLINRIYMSKYIFYIWFLSFLSLRCQIVHRYPRLENWILLSLKVLDSFIKRKP